MPSTAPSTAAASSDRKADRHIQILEAAVRAFSRHGYHNCTMAAVAREAGVADGTLYLYVKGKQDLLVTAFRHVLDRMMESLDGELSLVNDPLKKLHRLMELHFEVMENDPDLAGFLQFQLRQPDPVIRRAIRDPLMAYSHRIEAVIDEGKAAGLIRNDIGTRAMRRMVFGSLDETVSAWWFRQPREPLAAKAAALSEIFLNGVAARS